jgi:uncharacterized membrane protein YidH (DUF202 family)
MREAFALVLRTPRLWGVQFLGNVLIFLLYAGWLRLPEAHWWDLLLNVLVIVLVVAAALTLHGGTLNYFQSAHVDRSAALTPEFKKALKHVLALAVWAAVFFFLWSQLDNLGDYQYSFPGYLRSELPSWLRKHTTDTGFTSTYMFIVGLLQGVVLPGLLLPLASLAARQGFRGFLQVRECGRTLRKVSYWVVVALAVIVGVAAIGLLLNWKMNPRTATLGGEEVSLFFRLLASYLIGLFAWLWVCSMLGRLGRAGQPEA